MAAAPLSFKLEMSSFSFADTVCTETYFR